MAASGFVRPTMWQSRHPWPPELVPVFASAEFAAGNTSGTVTLAGAAGLTTYLVWLSITAQQVSSVVDQVITVTGLVNAQTMRIDLVDTVTAGAAFWGDWQEFPIPANAKNTAIVVNVPGVAGFGRLEVNMFGVQG